MSQRAAVLDLGTNTFNLLIGERVGDNISLFHRDEKWVNLAEDGMNRIGDNAMARMKNVLREYAGVIEQYQPQFIRASATAMFRNATNSETAKDLVKEITGVEPDIVSGDEEATLIYEGVRLGMKTNDVVLVMDIGGGSTEFIIGKGDDILWKKSYALGATLLRQRFHTSEPIAASEREQLLQFVSDETTELKLAVQLHKPVCMIGASGSFDSFASMLSYPEEPQDGLVSLDVKKLNGLVDDLCNMDEQQRKLVPGLVWFRAGPIVTAGLLTQFIMTQFGFNDVLRSAYAMKEGMLRRLLL